MKKGVGILIGILFGLNIVLVVVIFLLITGVVNVNINGGKNRVEKSISDNVDNKNVDSFVISYKDEVFEKSIGNGTLKNTRNIPVITNNGNQAATDKIVDYLTKISDKDFKDANDYSNELVNMGENYTIGVSYLFKTLVNNNKVVTIGYELSGSMGGVSWSGTWGYNFNPKTGDILDLTDVLVEEGTVELLDVIISEIEKKYDESSLWQKDSSSGYWKDIVEKDNYGTGSWFFTDSGISITFGKYLLGPGSTGVVRVDIPKEKINMYLKEEYKIS